MKMTQANGITDTIAKAKESPRLARGILMPAANRERKEIPKRGYCQRDTPEMQSRFDMIAVRV